MTSTTQSPEVINFGKFKGTALTELKHSYVRWLLTLEALNENLRKSLKSLPWIQEELDRESAFQKRKAKAILFSQPCFQRERYSANQSYYKLATSDSNESCLLMAKIKNKKHQLHKQVAS